MCGHVCGGQRTTWGNQWFSPSTVWVLGTKFRLSDKHLYSLKHHLSPEGRFFMASSECGDMAVVSLYKETEQSTVTLILYCGGESLLI